MVRHAGPRVDIRPQRCYAVPGQRGSMKILIASAEPEDAQLAADLGAVGILTNPALLAQTGPDWRKRLAAAMRLTDGPVHMQTTERSTERILAQFEQFRRLAGERLVATVCMNQAGMAAARKLQESLIPTNITAVVTFNQATVAAQSGADCVSIGFDRVAEGGPEGVGRLIEQLAAYLTRHRLETQIVATDVRNPDQYHRAAEAGAHLVAAPAGLLATIISHHLTTRAIDEFEAAWKSITTIK